MLTTNSDGRFISLTFQRIYIVCFDGDAFERKSCLFSHHEKGTTGRSEFPISLGMLPKPKNSSLTMLNAKGCPIGFRFRMTLSRH